VGVNGVGLALAAALLAGGLLTFDHDQPAAAIARASPTP
jgi:hypothetical protein